MRLINLLVRSLDIFGKSLCLEQFWGAFAESLKAVVMFVTSVCMNETARLTLDGLS